MQRVCINGVTSSWLEVLCGVPQGSVLEPILFLIYINDLDNGIKNWILKFAGDTKTFSAVNNNLDRRFLQKDLDNLLIWADTRRQAGYWVLSTDLSKTKTETFYSAYIYIYISSDLIFYNIVYQHRGVCKYYIGPIGDLSLSTATAAAADAHSPARN